MGSGTNGKFWIVFLGVVATLALAPFGQRQSAHAAGKQVTRNFDVGRTRTPHRKQPERLRQRLWQFGRLGDPLRQAGDLARDRQLPGQLVQEAASPFGLVAAVLARDHEHRNRVLVGLAHRGGDVGEPRTGDGETDSRTAAGARVTVGHEAQPLFVAPGDVTDPRARQRAVQFEIVHARYAEHVANPQRLERPDEVLTQCCHPALPRGSCRPRRYYNRDNKTSPPSTAPGARGRRCRAQGKKTNTARCTPVPAGRGQARCID